MEYGEMSTILKRFSFEEKMRIAQHYSRNTFTAQGMVDIEILRKIPSPWELETFVLFSVKAQEWKGDDFQGKSKKKFEKMIDCIRNKNHSMMEPLNDEEFITWVFVTLASVQFDIQECSLFKMYRFNYFFSYINDKINMPQLFREKFGCEYYQYALLGYILWIGFSLKSFTQELFDEIIKIFLVPVNHLVLSREEYISNLDSITTNSEDYLYCLRPSYSYPFIEYKEKVYCPLPHLLMRATSASLMYRLTNNNLKLIELIGKEVYEDYLYTIIKGSGIFDEVIQEKEYMYHKDKRRTVDIMARCDNDYVFFDSKSFTPKAAIRNFSKEALEKDVVRLAESCVQIYKHIRQRFPNEYCFFEKKPGTSASNIYGLVVIQESPYIRGHRIYQKVAELLNISEESEEYIWLCSHVGITTIFSIERYCFTGTQMCSSLHKMKEIKDLPFSWLRDDTNKETVYEDYNSFIERVHRDMACILREIGNRDVH